MTMVADDCGTFRQWPFNSSCATELENAKAKDAHAMTKCVNSVFAAHSVSSAVHRAHLNCAQPASSS